VKVLALTPQPRGVSPGQRYRIEQWEPHLSAGGVEMVYSPFATSELAGILYARGRVARKLRGMITAYFRQLRTVRGARRFDLVYVFREATLVGPAILESMVSFQRVPFVFDFDDAVYLRYRSPSNGYLSYLKFPGKTATLCRRASHVMAGNEILAEYANRFSDRVSVVPTTIDTDRYRPEIRLRRSRPPGTLPTIGWTGSHSTRPHLELAVPALRRLARAHPFRLVVIGASGPEIPGAVVESRPWRASTEVDDLADVDVGIMPLPDDAWSRGKCGCKALQYMGLAIPAVVSPVGMNTTLVRNGENGLWADAEEEWVVALTSLMTRPDLASRLGEAGRRTVETEYSAKVVAGRVLEIFRTAVASRAARGTGAPASKKSDPVGISQRAPGDAPR
jgi:glycosyltransferase involved in cell wall biosynthesis